MDILRHLDLSLVGVTSVIICILGFTIFFRNRHSVTNRAFLFFSLLTVLYGVFNYLNYQVSSPLLILWFLRLTIFFAVWHAFSIFHLVYIFPKEQAQLSAMYKRGFVPVVLFTSLISLTPLVFSGISDFAPIGEVTNPERGPGIILFGLVVTGLIIATFYILLKKTRHAVGEEQNQLRSILIGTLMTFTLIIFFNFVLPVVFNNLLFLPLAPAYFLPFITFTFYAIVKHRLLDVKVIATEILTSLLVLIAFFEILLVQSPTETVFRALIFTALLVFGILLIRSVLKEVQQRERLQTLSLQLEEANEHLKVLDQQKSEFVSMAGHQLRAPLTVIKGYISLVQEGEFGATRENKKLKDALTIVANSTNQLVKLVSDLLDLSRIESGKISYNFKEGDVAKIAEGIVKEYAPKAKDKKLKLVFENNVKDPAPFLFDPDKIREVMINLIDNAIRYSKEGEIVVSTGLTNQNTALRLSVKDHGIGIKKEDFPQLFVKFTRLQEAKNVEANGTGIGLYFVKRIVEDHGGRVGVESPGLGKGSTFWVEMPTRRKEKPTG